MHSRGEGLILHRSQKYFYGRLAVAYDQLRQIAPRMIGAWLTRTELKADGVADVRVLVLKRGRKRSSTVVRLT